MWVAHARGSTRPHSRCCTAAAADWRTSARIAIVTGSSRGSCARRWVMRASARRRWRRVNRQPDELMAPSMQSCHQGPPCHSGCRRVQDPTAGSGSPHKHLRPRPRAVHRRARRSPVVRAVLVRHGHRRVPPPPCGCRPAPGQPAGPIPTAAGRRGWRRPRQDGACCRAATHPRVLDKGAIPRCVPSTVWDAPAPHHGTTTHLPTTHTTLPSDAHTDRLQTCCRRVGNRRACTAVDAGGLLLATARWRAGVGAPRILPPMLGSPAGLYPSRQEP